MLTVQHYSTLIMPLTDLRDRVDKRVDLDCTKSNPEPLVSQIQEMKFVNHFKDLASVGQAHTMIKMVFITKYYYAV